MAREVGISNITLFPLTADDAGSSPTYGTGFKVAWAVNFETESEYAEGQYHGDNIVETFRRMISKMGITMEVSSNTPPALDAKITGKGYKNGKSFVEVGQTSPYYAIAYEILMDDGNIRRRVIYKVALTRNSQTNSTQEDSLEGQTYTYEGTAIPLTSTGHLEMIMDKKEIAALSDPDKTLAQNHFDKFFNQPILPNLTTQITRIDNKM